LVKDLTGQPLSQPYYWYKSWSPNYGPWVKSGPLSLFIRPRRYSVNDEK